MKASNMQGTDNVETSTSNRPRPSARGGTPAALQRRDVVVAPPQPVSKERHAATCVTSDRGAHGVRNVELSNRSVRQGNEELITAGEPGDGADDLEADVAEAEAAEAEAIAAAARARATAMRLRRRAQSAAAELPNGHCAVGRYSSGAGGTADTVVADATESHRIITEDQDQAHCDESAATPSRRRRLRWRWSWSKLAVGLAVLLTVTLLAASGYMIWYHHNSAVQRHRAAEFAAAASQGVVSLTTLDFNRAQEDVQHVLDTSTGPFKDDFYTRAQDFIKTVQDSNVVTKGTVNATAVESMHDDSAVVLVAATSQITNGTGAQKEPRAWRLSVTMTREGEQLKMSKVEFVP
jgi:Mce-associated membrane protein